MCNLRLRTDANGLVEDKIARDVISADCILGLAMMEDEGLFQRRSFEWDQTPP